MSKVLIIEDEVAIADLEKDYLELSGFEVETENDGVVGLKRALSEDFDMYREIQWKCQYEDALIQPPRGVLDINMGKYASGGR